MTEEIKQQIIKWIFDNHNHHDNADDETVNVEDKCWDADYPYVNSLELEKFIKSIEVKN